MSADPRGRLTCGESHPTLVDTVFLRPLPCYLPVGHVGPHWCDWAGPIHWERDDLMERIDRDGLDAIPLDECPPISDEMRDRALKVVREALAAHRAQEGQSDE